MTGPSVQISGVSKAYGRVQALSEVSAELHPGEIVALAGENGSGKSTLSKVVAGLAAPDSGEVRVGDRALVPGHPADSRDAGIVLVPQEPSLAPHLSIAENVLLGELPRGLGFYRRSAYVDAARPFMERIALDLRPETLVEDLPPGDRAMVAVAAALAAEPRFLIFDETTSRLVERDVDRLFEVVRDLRAGGTGIVLITHRLREICMLADRAVVLRDGAKVAEMEREQLAEEKIAAAMVGRELSKMFPARTPPQRKVVLSVRDLVVEGGSEPVSFDVAAGEVLGLAGLVGSGRTRIAETISGAREPRAGTVAVDGKEVRLTSTGAALRAGITIVPQDRHGQGLNMIGTVRENINLGGWSAGFVRRSEERRVGLEAIARLGIRAPGVDAPVRNLSGGNQQKVVLGRCLARNPRVLVLDEPTRGVDVGAKEELFHVIGEMLDKGMAVVMVSSEMLEVLGMCDRILVLHERAVVGEMSHDEATEEKIALMSGGGTEVVS